MTATRLRASQVCGFIRNPVISVLSSALPFSLFSFAEQYVTASTAAIMNATSPFFGAAAGAIWLAEPLSFRTSGGTLVGFAGVVVLVGGHAVTVSQPVAPQSPHAWSHRFAMRWPVYVKRRMQDVSSIALAYGSQLAAAIEIAPICRSPQRRGR